MQTRNYQTLFTSSKFLLALLLPVLIMFCLGVIDSMLFIFCDYEGVHLFIGKISFTIIFTTVLGIGSHPCQILLSLLAVCLLFRKKLSKAGSWILIAASIFASFFLQYERGFFEMSLPYAEFLQLTLNKETDHCISTATEIEKGQKFGLCRRSLIDDAMWAGDSPFENVIIYDSGDQILLPDGQRSAQWLGMAEKTGLRQEVVDISCIKQAGTHSCPIDMFGGVKSLSNHFYYVYLKEFRG